MSKIFSKSSSNPHAGGNGSPTARHDGLVASDANSESDDEFPDFRSDRFLDLLRWRCQGKPPISFLRLDVTNFSTERATVDATETALLRSVGTLRRSARISAAVRSKECQEREVRRSARIAARVARSMSQEGKHM